MFLYEFFINYIAVQPPSTTIFWPVTYFDKLLAKKAIVPLKSSSAAILPNGVRLLYLAANSSEVPSVWTPPGESVFTLSDKEEMARAAIYIEG